MDSCELCGEFADVLTGCCVCARFTCSDCEANESTEEEELICKECFDNER